jgi:HD-GYP domain-containing protein (c-di-GMP phosphodiesterase class II)
MGRKGYPEGLQGSRIPLWARMTAVADTYDALTSDRPYRKGMPKEKALQIITDVSGSQLCPDCVKLFLKWMDCESEAKGVEMQAPYLVKSAQPMEIYHREVP